MTHSGGKPHTNVGDRGQRFEVTFREHDSSERRVLGWADTHTAARDLVQCINLHPSWEDPQVRDRNPPPPPPPVDRSQRAMTSGTPETPDHREIKENGQQKDYVILSAEERAKGFVRPVRRTYVHQKCGVATTMSQDIAETYARDPYFYSGTFCVGCRAHFPVGEDGQFIWDDGSKVGT